MKRIYSDNIPVVIGKKNTYAGMDFDYIIPG